MRLSASSLLFGVMVAAVFPSLCAAAGPARSLSLEDRVAAQRAIEEVYWSHRLWPKENPRPKPSLSSVLPDAAIRARVEDTLRKSNALEKYWHRPILPDQLQAELDRMAAQTHDPRLLLELFAALGKDGRLIAETLARQTLVDRQIRTWYATDERFHREVKSRAEAALAACRSAACMPSMGGDYRETSFESRDARGRDDSRPLRQLSGLEETPESLVVTTLLSRGPGEVRAASVTWPKVPFDAWWRQERPSLGTRLESRPMRFTLPLPASSETAVGSRQLALEPARRSNHTAIWTGTEMIVSGGRVDQNGTLAYGTDRYVPSTDTWSPLSAGAGSPSQRYLHTAVWTGTEMIVWGGTNRFFSLQSGARYDPATDTWTPTSTGTNVPEQRSLHTAVWTGTEMVVWGGRDGHAVLQSGGRYDPATDTWSATSTGANVPGARYQHTSVWTGTEMIVWGGLADFTGGYLSSGGRYDPFTDTWIPTSTGVNVPSARVQHTAVWTGTTMIVWGGSGASDHPEIGGRYDPSTDTWTHTSIVNTPGVRNGHTAVWTGRDMIIWGGVTDATGGRYNPSTDTWTATSTTNVPLPRFAHSVVWTGTEMIVWGGDYGADSLNTGGRYDPSTDTWTPTSSTCPNGIPLYLDGDGDGYGGTGVVVTSCDGTIPAGFVANNSDCDDLNALVHPGAPELCNELDDDCNGITDEAAPPGPLPSLTLRGDSPVIEWTPLVTAQSYDVVYGDIAALRAIGGGYATATLGCIAPGTGLTSATFSTDPPVGQAFWILGRGNNCGGAGTYDSGAPSQVGSRDAGINASQSSCSPAVCGDGSCSLTESCSDCPADCGVCPCANDSECQPASCCNAIACITIWEPQSCNDPNCEDGCWVCITGCACQNGECVGVY